MSEFFLGEIRICAFNFPPKGWAMCNGQFLPINQNQALFALFGTMYGGNGVTNFALPDLRGRVAMHKSTGFTQGERAGEEFHTVTVQEMPLHSHQMYGISALADEGDPAGRLPAQAEEHMYADPGGLTATNTASTSAVGGSQPHENRMPLLVVNFIVALQGIFPSQN